MHLLHRWNCPWDSDEKPERARVGAYGELVAASWLRSQGMRVLRRGFRWGQGGEVDLVCRDGDMLVFVEVKSGTAAGPYPLSRKVDAEKRALLRRGARNWFMLLGAEPPHRFVIVVVLLPARQRPQINHLVAAFDGLQGGGRLSSSPGGGPGCGGGAAFSS